MTISSSEIRRNMTILLEDDLYQILDWQHRQAPKAPPTLTLKVRQISTGNVYEKKLPGNQKLTAAPTERRSVQYLYAEGDLYTFMDNETYDQFQSNDCQNASLRNVGSNSDDRTRLTPRWLDQSARVATCSARSF